MKLIALWSEHSINHQNTKEAFNIFWKDKYENRLIKGVGTSECDTYLGEILTDRSFIM